MKVHRFINEFDLSQINLEITNTEIVHQIKDVLKLKKDEFIMLGDGKGKEAHAQIQEIKKDAVEVFLKEVKNNKNELDIAIRLFCSILKRGNFELVIQKATELGVRDIIPLICERTIKTKLNTARLNKIIKEAAEQSERGVVPVLHPLHDFKEVLEQKEEYPRFLFDKSGKENITLRASSLDNKKKLTSVDIFIGPEGGWTVQELRDVLEQRVKIISLGDTTLRAETAVIGAIFWARIGLLF